MMRNSCDSVAASLFVLPFLFAVSGCEAMHEAGVPGMERFVDLEGRRTEAQFFREQYVSDKSPAALRWLLQNQIRSGMTLDEVNHVFGHEGRMEHDDLWITTKGGHYRRGDEVYKWTPDSEGNVPYLVFRDKMLVNFDPNEYADQF